MKVKFIAIYDAAEKKLKSEITGKRKEQYIGQVGQVIHRCCCDNKNDLFDVRFPDGQVWCFDQDQLEIVPEK